MLKPGWNLISSSNQWTCFLKARFLRNFKPVGHHGNSSIWPSLRKWYSIVIENVSWQIGNGKSVNFWTDKWLYEIVVDLLLIPSNWRQSLCASVEDFIVNGNWSIPVVVQQKYPALLSIISHVQIPSMPCDDKLVWTNSVSGQLSFKEAYLFLNPERSSASWNKHLWLQFVPPSRSFIVWRLFHCKMATDENLKLRGCVGISMCSLCGKAEESSSHLFLHCDFSQALWLWLDSTLYYTIDTSSILNLLSIGNHNWSAQMMDVVISVVINTFWVIWFSRNLCRFESKLVLVS